VSFSFYCRAFKFLTKAQGFSREILNFMADKPKTFADYKLFVREFVEETDKCESYSGHLVGHYCRLLRDLTSFERTDERKRPPVAATRAETEPGEAKVAVGCVLNREKYQGAQMLTNALKSGLLPNFASFVLASFSLMPSRCAD
jgi:hypothetical protein